MTNTDGCLARATSGTGEAGGYQAPRRVLRRDTVTTVAPDLPRKLRRHSGTAVSVRERTWPWAGITVAVTTAVALLAIVVNHRFYFYDDTQIGAFGNWYELGTSLRQGRWPILDPSRWMGGNIATEGQWGVWNPVVLAIGLLATTAGNALVFSLSREVGAPDRRRARDVPPRPGPRRAGSAQCGGRRRRATRRLHRLHGRALLGHGADGLGDPAVGVEGAPEAVAAASRGVFWAFACSYLIVTIGYVHGTIMLAVMYGAVLVGGLATGQERRGLLSVLGCGALTALVTITVYLPSALTADVTVRAQRGITNSDFLSPDLAGIVSSVSPEALTVLPGWWPDGYAPAPILYVAWFLPVAGVRRLVGGSSLRCRDGRLVGRARGLARPSCSVRATSGRCDSPSGCCRTSALSAIVARRRPPGAGARPARSRRADVIAALGWVAVATYLTWAGRPPTWEILGLSAVLTAAGLVATRWSLASRTGVVDWRRVGLVMIGGHGRSQHRPADRQRAQPVA